MWDLSQIAYYAKWAWAGLFGIVIAWWVWTLIAIGIAIAALVMLPGRAGQGLAALALIAGMCISAFAFGNDFGSNLEAQRWQRMMQAESMRLMEEAEQGVAQERLRTAAAEQERDSMKGTVDELTEAAEKAERERPAGSPPPSVCVPESVARGLRDWTGRRARGGRRQ